MSRTQTVILAALVGLCASFMIHALARSAPAPGSGHGFLIDKHVAAKLNCGACHSENPPNKAPEMATCLGCHGGTYDKLGAATAQKLGIAPGSNQPNPHASHQGPVPCANCHHVHAASVMFCNGCHNYEMTTP